MSSKFLLLPVFGMCLLVSGLISGSQLPSSSELLDKAIARHDPHDRWATGVFEMNFDETRPDGRERFTDVTIDNRRGHFAISTTREEARKDGRLNGEECLWLLNGSAEFTDEERKEYRLTCDDLKFMRNYYAYLWGLPMKLKDPGTRLDETVEETEFMGETVWSIRVTYDESVGSDTWYFYFDPSDNSLIGYRFFHDETKGDGEYIILEGEISVDGLTLPASRTWYTNAEDDLLGTDTLEALKVSG